MVYDVAGLALCRFFFQDLGVNYDGLFTDVVSFEENQS